MIEKLTTKALPQIIYVFFSYVTFIFWVIIGNRLDKCENEKGCLGGQKQPIPGWFQSPFLIELGIVCWEIS